MRWSVLFTVLLFGLMTVVGHLTAAKEQTAIPVSAADSRSSGHAVIGDWVEATAAGPVAVSFVADGTVRIDFPDVVYGNLGSAVVGDGLGTWEQVGADGVVYEVVRTVFHESGRNLASISIKGYLVLSPDGRTFTDDGRLTIITTRNSTGNISAISGVSDNVPVAIARRAFVGQTGIARPPSNQLSPTEKFHGGCNTCR